MTRTYELAQPPGLVLPDVGPEDFVLPEPEVYWTCWGWVDRSKPKRKKFPGKPEGDWRTLYRAASHAEDCARENLNPQWTWDGEPATPITLQQALEEARKSGFDGMALVEKVDGVWTVTQVWRVGE